MYLMLAVNTMKQPLQPADRDWRTKTLFDSLAYLSSKRVTAVQQSRGPSTHGMCETEKRSHLDPFGLRPRHSLLHAISPFGSAGHEDFLHIGRSTAHAVCEFEILVCIGSQESRAHSFQK